MKGGHRQAKKNRQAHIAMGRAQNAGKPAKLEQNKVNQFTHSATQQYGLALIKGQGNFT
jgi:hypothetical protein